MRFDVGANGALTAVVPGSEPSGCVRLAGPVVPGLSNLHSHAFQRLLVGRTQRATAERDSFWTWRTAMYGALHSLGPEALRAIAAGLYVELLEGGFTAVGEFHYVHHRPDGRPYDCQTDLSDAVLAGACDAGIALCHLPVLYQTGGFGGVPPTEGQRRFICDTDQLLRILEGLAPKLAAHPDHNLGVAPHSLRAVPPDALERIVSGLRALPGGETAPVHIHIAEQQAEVEACVAWSGARPVQWLLDHAPVDGRWCLVHATHLDPTELAGLVRSGAVAGLCPTTEADLGDGVFPLPSYLSAGGAFGVGTDSHVGRSATAELRLLEHGQRLVTQSRCVVRSPETPHNGAALWLQAAAGGAQALGRPAGALVVGQRADLVVFDPDHPVLWGLDGDAVFDGAIHGGESPVHTVVVGGKVTVECGRHIHRDALLQGLRVAISEVT